MGGATQKWVILSGSPERHHRVTFSLLPHYVLLGLRVALGGGGNTEGIYSKLRNSALETQKGVVNLDFKKK